MKLIQLEINENVDSEKLVKVMRSLDQTKTSLDSLLRLTNFLIQEGFALRELIDTLQHKKTLPMMRGTYQEYHLTNLLNFVPGLIMIPKSGQEDHDLIGLLDGFIREWESKLSKCNGIKYTREGTYVSVKCMRSRTSGWKRCLVNVERYSKLQDPVSAELLFQHSDNCRASDFEGVFTTIGNAFRAKGGQFRSLKKRDYEFLADLGVTKILDLQNVPFFCQSKKLVSSSENHTCNRRGKQCETGYIPKCDGNCGFIPHYPVIFFPRGSAKPSKPWVRVNLQMR